MVARVESDFAADIMGLQVLVRQPHSVIPVGVS